MHEENEVESVTDIFDDIDAAKVDLDFQKVSSSIDGGVQDQSPDAAPIDSDPFDLAPLINKTRGKDFEMKDSETPIFPPKSSHKVLGDLHKSVGFSLLERLEETIKVGLALGLNMEGCENTLAALIANNGEHMDGILVAMGDFNEVREAGERFGSHFNERHADIFNTFISNASLIDVPLGGYKFTWTDKWGSKMSKLDRFLVSKSHYDSFPRITGFHDLVVDTWGIVEANGLVSFKKKLQHLKHVIRDWVATKRSVSSKLKKEHLSRLSPIDVLIDQ
ncbi:RNA-directed DNA polymerase, eukaryota, reverse transcriptase zinc-binding domain protein, partial [Tanacetum coccineum]